MALKIQYIKFQYLCWQFTSKQPLKKYIFCSSEYNILTSVSERVLSNNDSKHGNNEKLIGSISHRFVETIEHLNSQYNYCKIEIAKDEIILLQVREC